MVDYNDQAIHVIEDYISRKKGLNAMQSIHRRTFDEPQEFSTWQSVEEMYADIEFTSDTFEDFLLNSRQVVKGGLERISESYFRVQKPENLTVEKAEAELNAFLYEERKNDMNEEPDGVRYERGEGKTIHASYIHTDVDTDITATGEIEERVSEGAVSFRIEPDEQLIVVESTYPPDVQRMKGVLGRDIDIAATVCGNLTAHADEANKRVDEFRESFPEVEYVEGADGRVKHGDEDDTPKLEDIEAIKLFNPGEEKEQIEKIDYSGQNLAEHPYIQERQDDGYIIRGFSAKVWFNGEPLTVAFSGSDMMGYAKVEDIGDYIVAKNLMGVLRNRYMDHFGNL